MPFLSSVHPALFFFLSSSIALQHFIYSQRGSPKQIEAKSHTHNSAIMSLIPPVPLRSPQMSNKAKFSLLEGCVKFVPKRATVRNHLDCVCVKTHLLYVFFFAPTFPCGCYFPVSRISIWWAICERGARHGETCETVFRMPFSLNDWKMSRFQNPDTLLTMFTMYRG